VRTGTARGGHHGVCGGKQQRPPQNQHGACNQHRCACQQHHVLRGHADNLARQQRERPVRIPWIQVDEQHRQGHAEAHGHPYRGILLALQSQRRQHQSGHDRAEHSAEADVDPEQQRRGGAHEREFGGRVHRKRHLAQHDQWRHHAGQHAQQRARHQCRLHEVLAEQVRSVC